MLSKLHFCWVLLLLLPYIAHARPNKAASAQLWNKSNQTGFAENKGQFTDQNGNLRSDVKYIFSAPGFKAVFKANSFSYEVYSLEKIQQTVSEASGLPIPKSNFPDKFKQPEEVNTHTNRIDVELPDAALNPKIITEERLTAYNNYYKEHTPEQGIQKVYSYQKLTYINIWPNIDICFYAKKEGELKYDIILRPGANINDVQFLYNGAQKMNIEYGTLNLQTALGKLSENIPSSYTEEDKKEVKISYFQKGNRVAFKGNFDKSKTLVIDPVLRWATYYGGTGDDEGYSISGDIKQNIYIAGSTNSNSYIATSGAYQTSLKGKNDMYIAKFDSAGNMKWATYYGASGDDNAYDIACDNFNNVYIVGTVLNSTGLATSGAFQSTYGGGGKFNAILIKLSGSGTRKWATYYGSNGEFGISVTCDKLGNVYFTGEVYTSTGMASNGAYQTSSGSFGLPDCLIAKFDSSGNRKWATYFGGDKEDGGKGIVCDDDGNVLVSGYTYSSNGIASAKAYQSTNGGQYDAFVAKFDSAGRYKWSTYFGDIKEDWATSVTCDVNNNIYITGVTNSSAGIATTGAYQTSALGGNDAFIAKYNSNGKLAYATYFGGTNHDRAFSISCDGSGFIYITGVTNSSTNISTSNAHQGSLGGRRDAFIAKFDSTGKIVWSTYYGGSREEIAGGAGWKGNEIYTDLAGNIYITLSAATQFGLTTPNAYKDVHEGGYDVLIAKFSEPDFILDSLLDLPIGICAGDSFQFSAVIRSLFWYDETVYLNALFEKNDTLLLQDSIMINSFTQDTIKFNSWVRFPDPGIYNIKVYLLSQDLYPFNDTLTTKIHVYPDAIPSFTYSENCLGRNTIFNNTSTKYSDTASFIWYFGDGDSSTSFNPAHIYASAGKYIVKLVTENKCTSKKLFTDTVEIKAPPKAGLGTDSVIYSCNKASVYIKALYFDSTYKYSYTFGDSTSADSSINPTHIYTKSGKYLVSQYVTNGICKDSVSDSINIFIEEFPKAAFAANQTHGCQPLTVKFTNASTNAFSYFWDFGDGIYDTAASPEHIFTKGGFHHVKLLAYNNQGCADSTIKDSFIYVSPNPKISYSVKNLCNGVELSFSDQSISGESYIWEIDGKTDTSAQPKYIFTIAGKYKIKLISINQYCQRTDTQTVNIDLSGILKSMIDTTKITACPNTEITFINKSKNSVKQTWYFGDGDTSTIFSPKHIYNSAGKYNVTLVSYSAEGCKDSITLTDYINILPYPEALFSTDSGTFTCQRVTYTYDNKSTHADSFRWSFGDGSPIQITYSPGTLTHSYGKSGEYKITITAFNGYCIDTAVILQQVNLRKPPIADFTIENNKLCISNATTKFANQSIFGDSYIWDFGDGTVDTNQNPTHTFTSPGKYNVTLVAKSKEGCTHTKIWENAISVSHKINAEFEADKTEGCAPLTVNFTPTKDIDTGLIYSWNFGNGKTSNQRIPTAVFDYGQKDSFYVKLVLSNKMCTDSFGQWIKILNLREDKDTARIILVTVENNQHVKLNWHKLNLAKIYFIQRSEDGTNYSYFTYTTDTFFTDNLADVHNKSYHYKITGIDNCGGRSTASPAVRTILLQGKIIGEDESATLNWNHYEGFGQNATHNLLRDNTITYSTSTENAFNDLNYFDENLLQRCYVVEAENSAKTLTSVSNEICLQYKPRIYIPNAFSPNDDAINEAFQPKTTGIKSFEINIYNRWGELVYTGNESTKGWDGKFRNTTAAEGVYFYIFSGRDITGKGYYRNGNINLLK